jgi:hypothetical protein
MESVPADYVLFTFILISLYVAVTKANIIDADGAKHVLPRSGAVLADKGYVGAIGNIKARGLHPMVILRNNMKTKTKDLDRWITKLHSPPMSARSPKRIKGCVTVALSKIRRRNFYTLSPIISGDFLYLSRNSLGEVCPNIRNPP